MSEVSTLPQPLPKPGRGLPTFHIERVSYRSDDSFVVEARAINGNVRVLFVQGHALVVETVEGLAIGQRDSARIHIGNAPAQFIERQIEMHRAALVERPNYADLHYRLGVLLKQRGEVV